MARVRKDVRRLQKRKRTTAVALRKTRLKVKLTVMMEVGVEVRPREAGRGGKESTRSHPVENQPETPLLVTRMIVKKPPPPERGQSTALKMRSQLLRESTAQKTGRLKTREGG